MPTSESEAGKKQNRRASIRRTAKASVRVVCRKGHLSLGPNVALRLLDISEGGACLVVKVELARGQEVEVVFTPQGGKEIARKGRIAWSIPKDDTYTIGVSFEKTVSYAHLGDLCKM